MKPAWNNLQQKFNELHVVVEDMASSLPENRKGNKLRRTIDSAWNDVLRAANNMDNFVLEKIDPITIPKPWNSVEFWEMWKYFKTYLIDQWGFYMGTYMERINIEDLKEWTNDDPEIAIRWLKHYIRRGDRRIYKVNEEDIKNDTKESKTGTIQLPKKPIWENSTTSN